MDRFNVTLPPGEAARIIEDFVLRSGMSTKTIASCGARSQDGRESIMLVFEKYFMRNSSRASLSVLVENVNGTTTVHAVGSGGGQGTFLSFDWGAAGDFEGLPEKALRGYTV